MVKIFYLTTALLIFFQAGSACAAPYKVLIHQNHFKHSGQIFICNTEDEICFLKMPILGTSGEKYIHIAVKPEPEEIYFQFFYEQANLVTTSIGKKYLEIPAKDILKKHKVKLYRPHPESWFDEAGPVRSSSVLRISNNVFVELEISILH